MSFQDDQSKSESHNSYKINEQSDEGLEESITMRKIEKESNDSPINRNKGRLKSKSIIYR